MASTSCSKREQQQKKAYSQELFNNKPLGEISSQASFKFWLHSEIPSKLLRFYSGPIVWCLHCRVCFPVTVFLGWPQLLQCPHSWLALAAGRDCASHLLQMTGGDSHHSAHQLLLCLNANKGGFPLPGSYCCQHYSLFLWGEISSRVWGGVGVGDGEGGMHFENPPQTLSKALSCVARRVRACHQIPLYCTFHSRAHLGIQETETVLTYRVDHKLLVN